MLNIDWDVGIARAHEVVRRHLPATPLVPVVVAGCAAPAFFKLETLQPTGAFKVRGALAALADAQARGQSVVTASAGNHGLGTAFAARALGVQATIFVPENAAAPKVAALREYRVDLRLVGQRYDDAEQAALSYAKERGATFISAYGHPDVIAGQATIMTEVVDQLDGPFQIIVPVGGGGLASGISLAAPDNVRVLGVQSARSTAVSAAIEAGQVVEVAVGETIADGLAGNIATDTITPSILRDCGTSVVSVGEDAIHAAVRYLALEQGLVVEGSGAVGVAAAHRGLVSPDLPAVFVLTGRNIAADILRGILAEPPVQRSS